MRMSFVNVLFHVVLHNCFGTAPRNAHSLISEGGFLLYEPANKLRCPLGSGIADLKHIFDLPSPDLDL